MQVVYGDVLFLINFCMDLICLYIAGRVASVRISAVSLLIASALGGVYGVVSVFMPGLAVLSAVIGFGVSLLMCFVCFGGRCGRRSFVRAVAVMYVSSILLGGLVTFVYGLLGRVLPELIRAIGEDPGGEKRTLLFIGVAAVCALLTLVGRRLLSFGTRLKRIRVHVTVERRVGSFTALVDSGNLLCDPITGRKVIVAGISRMSGVIPDEVIRAVSSGDVTALERLSYRSMKRVRLIPSVSVGSGRLLVGYLPDRIEIEGERGERYAVDAMLAFDGDSAADFGGCEAIVPSSLVA